MSDTLTAAPAANYVGGEWRPAVSGETYEKRNPWRPAEVTASLRVLRRRGRARGRGGRRRRRARPGRPRPPPARAAVFAKAAAALEARASGWPRT